MALKIVQAAGLLIVLAHAVALEVQAQAGHSAALESDQSTAERHPTFDCQYYLNKYADLRRAYGTNCRAALNHWNRHGRSEGRFASRAAELQQRQARLQAELKSATDQQTAAKSELDAANSQLDAQRAQTSELRAHCNQELARLEQEHEREVDQMHAEFINQMGACQPKLHAVKQASLALGAAKTSLRAAQEAAERLQIRIQTLRDQAPNLEQAEQSAIGAVAGTQEPVEQASQSLAATQREVSAARSNGDSAEELAKLEERAAEQQNQKLAALSTHQRAAQRAASATRERKQAEARIQAGQESLDQQLSQVSGMQAEKQQAEQHLDAARAAMSAPARRLLAVGVAQLEATNTAITNEIGAAQTLASDQRTQKASAEAATREEEQTGVEVQREHDTKVAAENEEHRNKLIVYKDRFTSVLGLCNEAVAGLRELELKH